MSADRPHPWRTLVAIALGALVVIGVTAGRAWVW